MHLEVSTGRKDDIRYIHRCVHTVNANPIMRFAYMANDKLALLHYSRSAP